MKEQQELKIKNSIKKSIKAYALRISGNYMVEEYADQYASDLTEEIWEDLEPVMNKLKV